MATATSAAIGKSGLPPLAKAAIISGAAVVGDAAYVMTIAGIKYTNKDDSNVNNSINNSNSNNININKENLFDYDFSNNSPIYDTIWGLNIISQTCFCLFILLCMQLLLKYYLNENSINRIKNESIKKYFHQIVKYNYNTNNLFIIFNIFIILFGLLCCFYFSDVLLNDLDGYIENYLKY